MSDTDDEADLTSLFREAVQSSMDGEVYGSWRSVANEDATRLNFGFPFPKSFPTDALGAATEAVLKDGGGLQYTGGEYNEHLKTALVDRANERGIDCNESELLLTNGATHAVDVICRTFLEPGDHVFVEGPTFMGALRLFKNYGVSVQGVPVDGDGLEVDALAETLEARSRDGRQMPKFVYTIPNYHNPTGMTLSADRRKALLGLAEEYDLLIVEDDPYGELRYDGDETPAIKSFDDAGRVLRVNTFSKTIAPGIRTGWIIGQTQAVEQLRRMDAGGTHRFSRALIGRYFADGIYMDIIYELRDAYEQRRDHLLSELDEYMPSSVTWSEPDGGFFVWVQFPDGVDTTEMLPRAAKEGVTYLPGPEFFPSDTGHNYARLSFSYATDNAITSGIEALGRATRDTLRTDISHH